MNEPPPNQSTPPIQVVSRERADGRFSRLRSVCGKHWGKLSVAASIVAMALSFGADELIRARVPHGVRVLGVDLSRLPIERAQKLLEANEAGWSSRSLVLLVDRRSVSLKPDDAGLSIDVARTLSRAREVDRGRSVFAHFAGWLARFARPYDLPLSLEVKQFALEAALDRAEREAVDLPKAGGIHFEGERFVAELPREGRRLDRELARRAVQRAVAEGVPSVRIPTIDAPAPTSRESVEGLARRANELSRATVVLSDPSSTRSLTLEPHDLRGLLAARPSSAPGEVTVGVDENALERVLAPHRAELESPPVNARFLIDAKDQVRIEPSALGTRLDMRRLAEAILQAAAAPDRRGALPFEVGASPELTTEGAEKLGIRRLLSTFTTRHACCERRVENIHRIADLLDGLLVRPGETVSVNAVVGPRTTKNGFVSAPTIEEGEMVDTIGGGISQFATTFFNALFYGGFDIIERQPHTYWFSRYPMGHEATLSYPKPDLVFRNDTENGMLIDTVYTNTSITVRIFGDNGGRKVRAEVSQRQNIVEPPVEILANAEVLPEEEHVREAGMIGWSVIVGRILTFPDGTKKEERRKVTYRPRTRRVEVHPCRVPKGEKGYTGERCPVIEESAELAATPAATR